MYREAIRRESVRSARGGRKNREVGKERDYKVKGG